MVRVSLSFLINFLFEKKKNFEKCRLFVLGKWKQKWIQPEK